MTAPFTAKQIKEAQDTQDAIVCELESAGKAAFFKVLGGNVPTYHAFWDILWADATSTLDDEDPKTDIEEVKNEIDNAITALISDLERVREAVSKAKVEL